MFSRQSHEASEIYREEPLNPNETDRLLLLLHAPGGKGNEMEPVEGITRLQKLVFLLEQDDPAKLVADAERFGFHPYKMGPYSEDLRRTVEDLVSGGIIETKRLTYLIPDDTDLAGERYDPGDDSGRPVRRVESLRYSLSGDIGRKVGNGLWERLTVKQQTDLSDFKRFFNALTLRQLLVYTYERYPQFTGESTIRGTLGL